MLSLLPCRCCCVLIISTHSLTSPSLLVHQCSGPDCGAAAVVAGDDLIVVPLATRATRVAAGSSGVAAAQLVDDLIVVPQQWLT